jgi:hypothetical protein
MKIIAKIDFTANNKKYIVGDEINDLTYEQIVRLNEMGFIKPLDYKDLVLLERELKEKKIVKKEEL